MYKFGPIAAALLLGAILAAPAAATSYLIEGRFKTIGGSSYSALSGGSFSGWFTLDDALFPMGTEKSAYLYDADFRVDIFDATGSEIGQLANTPSRSTYLQIATTYASTYGGLRIFFRVASTDYLQLVMPLDFDGSGDIMPAGLSYALVLGTDYAQIQSGTVTALAPGVAVPETASWLMMAGGFAAVGLAMRRKSGTVTVAFA